MGDETDGTIQNVADTAFWVAQMRAEETARSDAVFNDPLAAELAGDRGRAIMAQLGGGHPRWSVIARTVLLDRWILETVWQNGGQNSGAQRCDMVLNLAAGLDTRPFRLALPPTLRWVEVDQAPLLDFKEQRLARHTPRCQRQVIAADLADGPTRRRVLAAATAEARRVLVLTEGLVLYLHAAEVNELASDLLALPCVHVWMLDVMGARSIRRAQRVMARKLARAPFRFGVDNAAAWFAARGWRQQQWHSLVEEALHLRRVSWLWHMAFGLALRGPASMRQEVRHAATVRQLVRA